MRVLWSLWFLFPGVRFPHVLLLLACSSCSTSGLLMLFLWTTLCLSRKGWVYWKRTLYLHPGATHQYLLISVQKLFMFYSSKIPYTTYDHINVPPLPSCPPSLLPNKSPSYLHVHLFTIYWVSLGLLQEQGREAISWRMSNFSVAINKSSLQKMSPLSPQLPEVINCPSVSGRGEVLQVPSSSTMECWGILILSRYITVCVCSWLCGHALSYAEMCPSTAPFIWFCVLTFTYNRLVFYHRDVSQAL